jgi:hypothetical protein
MPLLADGEIAIRVTAGASEVDFGKAFPLEVVRTWEKPLVPDEWNDRALAPLAVRLVEATRSEAGNRVVETRRYAAYAFARGEALVPAPTFVARPPGGGRERTARGEPVRIAVRPSILDAGAPGPPELPGDLLEEPFPWLLTGASLAAVAALAAFLFLAARGRRRASAPVATQATRGVSPRDRALARLARLRELDPRTHEEERAHHLEAAALLRDFVADEHGIDAPAMTREEVSASPQLAAALGPLRRARLAACLAACDLVVFAHHEPLDAERRALLDATAALLSDATD